MINKYIKSLGAEIECGIDYNGFEELKKMINENNKISYSYDGSVFVSGKNIKDLEIKFYDSSFNKFKEIAYKIWSLGIKQNSTCGNHIHVLFNEKFINRIFWSDFINRFFSFYEERYENKEKYMYRLKNNYCLKNNKKYIFDFLNGCRINRYRAINFLSYKTKQNKTIEFRVMPYADNYNEWIENVEFIINFIRIFFKKEMIKNKIIKVKVEEIEDLNLDYVYYSL